MGIVHHPNVVTDGLIACWDAANRKSYPGAGTVWTDLAGSHDGTIVSSPTFSDENMGIISFDGTDDKITFNLPSEFSGINLNDFDCTFEGWCRFEGSDINQFGAIVAFGSYDLTLGPLDEDGNVGVWVNNAALTMTYTAKVNEWHHYVMTKEGSLYTFFADGYNVLGTGGALDYDNATVGSTGQLANNGSTNWLEGSIPLARLYNRALPAEEVLQNYNATKRRFIGTESDSLIFKMDAGDKRSYPGTGTTWTDLAQGNVGTFASSPSFSTDAGGAMLLDGTDDYLEIASPGTSYRPATEMTLSAWIKPDDFGTEAPILSKWHSSDGNWASYSMRVATDADFMFTTQNETGSDYPYWTSNQAARRVLTSEWNHIVCVWRGAIAGDITDVSLYLNGVIYTAFYSTFSAGGYGTSYTTLYSTYKLAIGARGGWFFDGAIAYASVHERALTDAEVLDSYNKTKGRFT